MICNEVFFFLEFKEIDFDRSHKLSDMINRYNHVPSIQDHIDNSKINQI